MLATVLPSHPISVFHAGPFFFNEANKMEKFLFVLNKAVKKLPECHVIDLFVVNV